MLNPAPSVRESDYCPIIGLSTANNPETQTEDVKCPVPEPSHPNLRDFTPNARALYWYLRARGGPVTVTQIELESGIPRSSIYEAVNRYPDTFTLTGSLITTTPPSHQSNLPPPDGA